MLITKVDKVYLSAPPKIVIIDHEKKRTYVLRKEGLPDVGELASFFSWIMVPLCQILVSKLHIA